MLQKCEMIGLQAISCYALLQVGKFFPSVRPGLIHRSHVLKTALIKVLVDLAFKTNRGMHSIPPFCKSTKDLVCKASIS